MTKRVHSAASVNSGFVPKPAKYLNFPRPDLLTQVLDGIRLRCMIPSAHEMTAPWGVEFGWLEPKRNRQHLESIGVLINGALPTMQGEIVAVLRGNCCLELPRYKIKLTLAGGDVVVIARKDPFIIRDNWNTSVRSIREIGRPENLTNRRGLRYGGGGVSTDLLTGPFFFDNGEDHPMIAALPPVMHIRGSESQGVPWLDGTLKFMKSELAASLPGSESIVNHLAHVLFVQAVRAYAALMPAESQGSLFHAVFDADLAPALGAMHQRPEEPWTVATLAEQASMSRSVFSARFTTLCGMPPLQYLTDCRMRKAKTLLQESGLGVNAIALKVGYSNESAFSNAFRRVSGVSPAAYRKLRAASVTGCKTIM